jgi:hypothetical protein
VNYVSTATAQEAPEIMLGTAQEAPEIIVQSLSFVYSREEMCQLEGGVLYLTTKRFLAC